MATYRASSSRAPNPDPSGGVKPPGAWKSLVLLLVAATLFLLAWSFAVPIFEAPDEPDHWQYARYLNQNHVLPIYGPAFIEANSPPLYYVLIAPLALETELPEAAYTEESGRKFAHFPPRMFRAPAGELGRYWPIRAARLLTGLISVLTVWFCYLAGVEAMGNSEAGLLVGGLVAFWPEFTFRGMNVSNDALVTMLSAAALYLMVRLVKRGFDWGIGVAATVAISGAFLSKPITIFMPAPLFLAIVADKASLRRSVLRVGVLGALMLFIVAPWLLRNHHLYGDVLAQHAMLTAVPELIHVRPLISPYFVTEFPLLLTLSFIGVFGWMNVFLPLWVYIPYLVLLALGAGSGVERAVRGRVNRRICLIILTILALNLSVVVYICLTLSQPQGRYLFPALPALALLLGLGLEKSFPGGFRNRLWAVVTLLAVANALILAFVVIPAYWPRVK